MDFWTAVVIIVGIGAISEIYRARLKASSERPEKIFQQFGDRSTRLEERMANIEAIVLEQEKEKKFHDLADADGGQGE